MKSPPLDSTHDRMTSGVTCHQRLSTTHMSDYVGHGMTSSPLDTTHCRTTSGVACHHRLWTAHTVEQRRAWHAIIAIGQHRKSDDVGRGMPSPPLNSIHGRAMSAVECHHLPWKAHTVGRHRAWNDINALGKYRRSNDFGCGMTSPPLDCMHGQMALGVA